MTAPLLLARQMLALLLFVCLGQGLLAQNAPVAPANLAGMLKEFRDLAERDPAKAESWLRDTLRQRREPALLFEAGLFESRRQRLPAAIAHFDEVLRLDPQFPGARRNRGLLLAAAKQPEAALPELTWSLEHEGPDGAVLTALGGVAYRLEQYTAAESAWRWALLLRPGAPELLPPLAQVLLAQRRPAEAVAVCQEALARGELALPLWLTLANAQLALGERGAALEALEAARLLHGDQLGAEGLVSLAELYLGSHQPAAAAALLLSADQAAPLAAERLLLLAEALAAQRAWSAAEALLQRLRERAPGDARTWVFSAQVARARGQVPVALQAVTQATTLAPTHGAAWLLRGELHAHAGDWLAALNAWRTARVLPGHEDAAMRHELNLWLKRQDWAEALALTQTLAQRSPQGEWDELLETLQRLVSPPKP